VTVVRDGDRKGAESFVCRDDDRADDSCVLDRVRDSFVGGEDECRPLWFIHPALGEPRIERMPKRWQSGNRGIDGCAKSGHL